MREWINIVEARTQDPNRAILRALRGQDDLVDAALVSAGTWLIHFSEDAREIAQHGFTRGTPLEDISGYTRGADYGQPGYNFAFAVDDEYSIRTLDEYDFAAYGGTDSAVMFRSSGVSCTHTEDRFNQVIFWGQGVQGPFVLMEREEADDDDPYRETHDHKWSVAGQVFPNLFKAIAFVESNVR